MKGKNTKWLFNTIKPVTILGLLFMMSVVNAANIAYLPQTGPGVSTSAGKQWPTTRFTIDVSSGCITDNLTGLMWANITSEPKAWGSAEQSVNIQYWISSLNSSSNPICGYTDWRLPNINELRSLINYSANQSGSDPFNWLKSQGFTHLGCANLWTSTPAAFDNMAWVVNFWPTGNSYKLDINNYYTACGIPVRGGR